MSVSEGGDGGRKGTLRRAAYLDQGVRVGVVKVSLRQVGRVRAALERHGIGGKQTGRGKEQTREEETHWVQQSEIDGCDRIFVTSPG